MDFSSPNSLGGPGMAGKMDPNQRDKLMDEVKAQIAIANAQELLQVLLM